MLVPAPDLDHDARAGLGDAAGLAQRGDHVVGEEEGVEAGDEAEGVIVPGQGLHLADAEIGVRQAGTRERDQRLGGVEAVWNASALGDEAEEGADTAADVEHVLPRFEAGALQGCLVGGELEILAQRPVGRTGAPERSPAGRAARACGRMAGHRRSLR